MKEEKGIAAAEGAPVQWEQPLRALYIRVSTEAQAEEGYSIQAQTERLEAYCRAMGWDNYRCYTDGGYSGSNLDRPEMTRLIADARAGRVATVVVFKLDRLSRSQKDTLYLIEDVFLPNGVDFISLNESIDTSTPYGRAMIGILSAFAQLERENIYLRTRMGMVERVRQGYWMGGGGVPFGYDYDRNTGVLVPNADAPRVRQMYELYLKGWSAQRIADLLGLKYDRLVTQILTRKSNIGIITYKGEEYRGLHQPIVPEELFYLVQDRMRERGTKNRTAAGGRHLLTGLVFCGSCGARMRYIRWGKRGYKLRCYGQDPSKPHMKRGENCQAQAVWAEELEAQVIRDLFQVSARLEEGEDAPPDPLTRLEEELGRQEGRLRRLYQLFAEGEDPVLVEEVRQVRRQLELLRQERDEEEATRRRAARLTGLRERAAGIREAWPGLTWEERQAVIRDCVERIVVDGPRVEIYYTFLRRGEGD